MLYKKYHRNYVKQFRSGIKFSYETYKILKDTVRREPHIGYCGIEMIGEDGGGWIIVFLDGRVDYKIKLE